MGIFDFFKGKGKKEEIKQQLEIQEEVELEDKSVNHTEKMFEIEGLEINPIKAEEGITLEVNKDTTVADIRNDVRSAMTENKLVIKLARVDIKEAEEGQKQEEQTEIILNIQNEEQQEDFKEAEIEEAVQKKNDVQSVTVKTEQVEGKKETDEKLEQKLNHEKNVTEETEIEKETPIQSQQEEMDLEEEAKQEEQIDKKTSKKGFFAKLLAGLDKTRKSIMDGVDTVLGAFTKIDEELFEELEEVLIMADLGVETTMTIIENLRKRVKKEKTTNPAEIKGMLTDEITILLDEGFDENYEIKSPTVLLIIGVNGVGKTTTIGKLANNFRAQGKNVLLAAADTFRAAAIDQLEIWGKRAEIDVIKHQENSDPAAVVFDAVNAAKNRKTDILICDTAGRLHNKKNLMEELKKISKVIDREYPEANKEVYLVLDATTGQNAMQQAKLFKEVADITGIILTKLDGTAKGGIVIAIKSELKIPVRYIGVGEGLEDLQKFNAKDFAKALFGKE